MGPGHTALELKVQLTFKQVQDFVRNNKRVMIYVIDPNQEKLVPFDPMGPCAAYKKGGGGNMFTWDPDAQLWR